MTVGVVTRPFKFEGKRRRKHADAGIARLKEHVDTLIVIPNDRLLKIATPELSMLDAFKLADNVLVNAVRGISDIINVPGTINVDFADVKTIMASMGHALMGIGTASGEDRATEAARKAISSPLLEDVDIEGATGILINITAGEKISLVEINNACSIIETAAHEDANIIFGAVIDENMNDELRITVIATGFPISEDDDYLVTPQKSSIVKPPQRFQSPRATVKQPAPQLREHPDSYNQILNQKKQDSLTSRSGASETPVSQQAPDLASPAVETSKDERSASDLDSVRDEDLTLWTMKQAGEEPEVDDSIRAEPKAEEPSINLFASTDNSPSPPRQEEIENRTNFTNPKPSERTLTLESETASDSIKNPAPKAPSPSEKKTPESPGENPFLPGDQEHLSDAIDKRIDEALELAEKVRSIERKEDDLDIPAFLRDGHKNIELT